MKYYCIIQDRCWADEFDTFGFQVFPEEEFKRYKKQTDEFLDLHFNKLTEEEFLQRQKDFQELKKSQGVTYNYRVRNIKNPLPYMHGGYGENKKFDSQYDAPYSAYEGRWSGYHGGPKLTVSFGTNEEHCFYSAKDYWSNIDIKEISEDEYNFIIKIMGRSEKGITFFPLGDY